MTDSRRCALRAIRYTPGVGVAPAGGFLVAGGGSAKQLGGIAFADGVYLVAWIEDGARFLAVFDRADGTSSSDVLGSFVPVA